MKKSKKAAKQRAKRAEKRAQRKLENPPSPAEQLLQRIAYERQMRHERKLRWQAEDIFMK